ncbi:MAG: hypothetical protein HY748_14465 [Elusimicrobia bacterium]|nr:hypothetical protein [Elusimicrobiota bacterium]
MMTILINAVVIALLVGAYFAWQALQQEPSRRWPKLAERLSLKYEGPPPRMTGPWKNRQVTVQPESEKAVVSFPVRRPENFRLEIGPRETVEKAAGIVVPDRLEFTEPAALAFNERFLVRCKPVETGRVVFDHVMRARLLALGEFHVLAEAGRFTIRLPLDTDASALRQIFDLVSSILDGVEG